MSKEQKQAQPQDLVNNNSQTPQDPPAAKHRVGAFLKTKKGRVLTGILAGALILIGLFAVPSSRYAILGTFIKKQVTVFVTEETSTNLPITDVQLAFAGQSVTTGSDGRATFTDVPVGAWQMSATKEYYTEASQLVKVKVFNETHVELSMRATGRQVPVTVINKISGQPVEGATLVAGEATAVTNHEGQALLVVPADSQSTALQIKTQGYNDFSGDLLATDQKNDKNNFAITPAGKLYFLSKRTGKINVMKSDLDGGNAQVVLEGTGKEEEGGTVLLASRDWKHLALKARRDSDVPKLYLIDTATDKLSLIDEGKVEFELAGWANGHFVYRVVRTELKQWESKRQALKTFNPTTGKITIIDENVAEGSGYNNYSQEFIDNVYIFGDKLTYIKQWYFAAAPLGTAKMRIIEVANGGTNKRTIKEFNESNSSSITAALYNPKEEYFEVWSGGEKASYYEYEDGAVKDAPDVKADTFSKFYPTYLVSPSSKMTFWYEPRDGKNTLLVGDNEGANGKEVLTLSDYATYGWFTDDYLLLTKGGSELSILPRTATPGATPLKVTDYHKPNGAITGYGYGYGGL